MAHKTITISVEAYEALARHKKGRESFTDAILRLASETGKAAALLTYLEKTAADEELAKNIEERMRDTRRAMLRKADFS